LDKLTPPFASFPRKARPIKPRIIEGGGNTAALFVHHTTKGKNMQNVKTHIVIGAVEGKDKKGEKQERKITVLYIGPSRHEAREIYLDNKSNLDFDFVGMDSLAGFKSRGRPKIDKENEAARIEALKVRTEEEISEKANIAEAAARAAGQAQLEAEAERTQAEEKLKALSKKAAPKKKATTSKKASVKSDDADADALLK